MLNEFWLDVIRQHTDLVDGVLTLKTNMKIDVDLFALEIKFRDGEYCMMIGRDHLDGVQRFNYYSVCTQAQLSDIALSWAEENMKSFTPRAKITGSPDYDKEFIGIEKRDVTRCLVDIVGIQIHSYKFSHFLPKEPEENLSAEEL